MKISCLIATLLLLGGADTARSQTPADSAAIRATALDYIEGWYAGDAERMGRAVHPELVKRIVATDPESGSTWIDEMGASKLIEGTRAGYGTQTPEADRRTDVTILDIFGNSASVRVDAGGWIDYMHLAKWDGRWTIVNVLWEMRGEAGA
ncbi:MAG: nuclear transport factor 2 family protein [Gemmatimonadota bacterium]